MYGDRIAVLHLKDMARDVERSFAEVGQGILDFSTILPEASRRGIEWWVVEQDRTKRTPEESISMSREALRAMGY